MQIGYGRLLGGGRGGGGKEVAGAKRPLCLAYGSRNTFEVCFYDVVEKCVSAQFVGCAILIQVLKYFFSDFESYKFLRDHVYEHLFINTKMMRIRSDNIKCAPDVVLLILILFILSLIECEMKA